MNKQLKNAAGKMQESAYLKEYLWETLEINRT